MAQQPEVPELLAAANDPHSVLAAFPVQGLGATNMSNKVLDQHQQWNATAGDLESSFHQMSFATHQSKVKTILDELCAAVTEPAADQRVIKANAILAKSKEAFEVYTQQEAALNTSSSDTAPKIKL